MEMIGRTLELAQLVGIDQFGTQLLTIERREAKPLCRLGLSRLQIEAICSEAPRATALCLWLGNTKTAQLPGSR
jgi:hypothetical protein